MLRHPKAWLVAAVLFGLGNVAGAVMAAIALEPLHAATHVVLALLSASVARALVDVSRAPRVVPLGAPVDIVSNHLARLEISLDGLASGVQQLREGQRTVMRLFAQRTTRGNALEHERDDAH